jgi:hypothetical protein
VAASARLSSHSSCGVWPLATFRSGANIIGYVRCKSDARSKIAAAMTSRFGGGMASKALQSAAGSAFGF